MVEAPLALATCAISPCSAYRETANLHDPGICGLSRWRRHPPFDQYFPVQSRTSQSGKEANRVPRLTKSVEPPLAGYDQYDLVPFLRNASEDADLRGLGREAVAANRLPHLLYGRAVIRSEMDGGQSLIEADLDRIHALDPLHGHAHGVGANCSVHPEDGLPQLQELGVRDGR